MILSVSTTMKLYTFTDFLKYDSFIKKIEGYFGSGTVLVNTPPMSVSCHDETTQFRLKMNLEFIMCSMLKYPHKLLHHVQCHEWRSNLL
jgi:hypothetical protein